MTVLVALLLFSATIPATAAVFVVDSEVDASDATPGDGACVTPTGDCTLRAAVEESLALPGDDVIQLPAGVFIPTLGPLTFPRCTSCDETLIEGAGELTVLDGGAVATVVEHFGGAVQLQNLTLRDAVVQAVFGGQALRLSHTTLSGATFEGNVASFPPRLIIEDSSSSTPLAIDSGAVKLQRVMLQDLLLNGRMEIELIEGSIVGDLTWTDSSSALTLDRMHVLGGVHVPLGFPPVSVNILNSTIEGSSTNGVRVGNELGSTLTLVNSVITGAAGCGVLLPGRVSILTIQDSDVTENDCGVRMDFAPQAASIDIEHSRIIDNDGTGLFSGGSQTTAVVRIVDSSISGNGGIGFDVEAWNDVTLRRSTLHDNAAGGIRARNTWFTPDSNAIPTLAVINSTISGNRSTDSGAGIRAEGASIALRNVTVAGNATDVDGDGLGDGGGIAVLAGQHNPATVTTRNAIVAENTDFGGEAPDCTGTIDSEGYNLVADTVGCTVAGVTAGNLLGQAPQLEPLADNGGFTLTHALGPESPALDGGEPSGCPNQAGATLTIDQRGLPRPADGDGDGVALCDIGSVEVAEAPNGCGVAGDINCDTDVCDLFDILAAIDQALGESGWCEADVDCSCAVNIFDVICLIDCALQKPGHCLVDPCVPTGCLDSGCEQKASPTRWPAVEGSAGGLIDDVAILDSAVSEEKTPASYDSGRDERSRNVVSLTGSRLPSADRTTATVSLRAISHPLRGLWLVVGVPSPWVVTQVEPVDSRSLLEPHFYQDGETLRVLLLPTDTDVIAAAGATLTLRLTVARERAGEFRQQQRIHLLEAEAADVNGRPLPLELRKVR